MSRDQDESHTLAAPKKALVARSSAARYELAAHHATIIQQAQARFAAPPSEQFTLRDRAMADNIVWLLEQAGPGARVMAWAHNGHVQLGSANLPGENMGQRLQERLGKDYVSVGFIFNKGSYRASPSVSTPRQTIEVPLRPIVPGDTAEAFERVGVPIFAVDLRAAPPGRVRDWLVAPHIFHSLGWLVVDAERAGSRDSLARLFDIAICVDRSTSSSRLPSAAPTASRP